jgi:pimeloyl-ACP methyl ester carboxylesterase
VASAAIEEFEINVDDAVLEDLRGRLAATRFPDQIEGTGWEYGMPVDYLRGLVAYWRDRYDWRFQEARLNQFDHFRTTIDGQSIHFIHARSAREDAFPLLLLHGWPGSVVEFLDVIPLLTDDFHVVVASLPGYGFSEPTRTPGWDPRRIARAFTELMPRLGYERYGAQGGDWGAMISRELGISAAERVIGVHLNMLSPQGPFDQPDLTDEEQRRLDRMREFRNTGLGYGAI